MKLTYHEEYLENLPYWKQIREFVKGKKGVQAYLQDVTQDKSQIGINRNKAYKERAKYTNYPARTRNAFVGSVFRLPPQIELPSQIDYLEDKANAYLSLEQLSKRVITNLIEVGRQGVLTDFADTRSNIVTYSAENIINWMHDESGKFVAVDLITSTGDVLKRLKLDESGLYAVDYYEIKENSELEFIETKTPTKGNGSRLDYIPFIFCGSTDNDTSVDDMPLWSIVDVTQGHYQNSADYEDFLRVLTPTPAITVPNKDWLDEMLPSGYSFGDGSILPLPEGGTALMLQPSANPMHLEAMGRKEEQLISLGARIITGGGQAETAEAVRIRYSSENSVLDNLSANASDAIKQALMWAYDFQSSSLVSDSVEITFELNREFFDQGMSPQEISSQILLLDKGVFAMSDLRRNLRQADVIEQSRTDADIDDEAEMLASGL